MAKVTPYDKRRYIDFGNLVVDYNENDVKLTDNVRNLADLFPLESMTNLIVLCNSGSATISIEASQMTIHQDDVLLCPASVSITGCAPSASFSCKAILLSDHIIHGLLHDKIEEWHHMAYARRLSMAKLSEVNVSEFNFYYALIDSKIRNHKSPPYEIMQALTRAMLLELCFVLRDAHGLNEEVKLSQGKILFNRFLGMISGNLVKRQPIGHYASELAITPKYLTMLCLKYSDKTASEWIIQYTTEDIRFYLRNSNLSIKEISAKLGFANMSHFGSYVRKHLGMSPSEFRHTR